MNPKKLIVAIDMDDAGQAAALISAVAPHCGLIKFGLQYFCKHGPAGLAAAGGAPVFLDLKLHDIPNTVAAAIRALLALNVAMVTIHAAGGAGMVAAAVAAARDSANPPKILAVTVLTSLDDGALHETGVSGGAARQVLRLAGLALAAGVDGLVCSAREIPLLRAEFGAKPLLITPGIRLAGADPHDQSRVMTPQDAVAAGADFIVVGRPVTGAKDPGAAAAAIAASMA